MQHECSPRSSDTCDKAAVCFPLSHGAPEFNLTAVALRTLGQHQVFGLYSSYMQTLVKTRRFWIRGGNICAEWSSNGKVPSDRSALSGSGAVAGPRSSWGGLFIITITQVPASPQRLRGVRQFQSRKHAAFLEQGAGKRAVRDLLPRLDRWTCAAGPGRRGSPGGPQERVDQADPESAPGLRLQVHRWAVYLLMDELSSTVVITG